MQIWVFHHTPQMLESFQLQRDFAPDQGSAPSTPACLQYFL